MFFLTFFFFGSTDSSTSSDTSSRATRFWACFLDGPGLVGVLVDLRAGFFFLTWLSTLSSGKGGKMGGLELRVQGHDKGTARATLGEVVVFL